jgi:hypothetical protein
VSLADRLCSVRSRGVEHAEHSEEFPVLSFLLDGHTERPETAGSKLLRLVTVRAHRVGVEAGELEDGVGRTLGAGEFLSVVFDFGGDPLGYGVEGCELVCLPSGSQHLLRFGVVLDEG